MFKFITVDPLLADAVEKELCFAKPQWQYSPITTNYHDTVKDEKVKNSITSLKEKYPIKDTQKFSDTFYNMKPSEPSFVLTRQNPQSRYNKLFPNTARLVDYLQITYIPNTYSVKRFLVNMQTIRPEFSINEVHPDFHDEDYITILYYVNNSDGDTYFFEDDQCINQIPPVKGTAVLYPSTTLHAGSTPVKNDIRVVINMCFGPKNK